MNNQAYKVRPEIINVNSNEPVLYPFSIKTSKCSGSCNNINDPYSKMCVPDADEYLNHRNCTCRKRLVDKLAEECNENIDEEKLSEIFEHGNKCICSYIVFIVSSVIVLKICIGISTYFVYYKYINRNKENVSVYDYVSQAKNY